MKPAYITTLTPLRGIAALLVVVFHFNMMVMPIVDPAITQLHRHWALMVDFFFILSGFIMTYVYGGWFAEKVTTTSFRQYMAARFARIYPLHLLMLLWVVGIYVLLVPINHRPQDAESQMVFDLGTIPLHLLMLHGFNQAWTGTWNLPAWSIGSEWFLYMLFPVLMLGFRRMPLMGKVALLLGVLGLYTYLSKPLSEVLLQKPWLPPMHHIIDEVVFPDSLLRCLAGFVLGMVLHDAYQFRWGARVLGQGVVFVVLMLGLLVAWHLNIPDLWTVWAFPGLILSAVYNTGQLANLLQTRQFQRLGDLSYSIYMTHVPVMFTFLAVDELSKPQMEFPALPAPVVYGLEGPVTCLVYVLIVLLVSALTYRFVEVPARNYLNAGLKRRQPLIIPSGST
ncbi:acyltransferase family protein [Spirosoma spitsbergense]|uniref:acyltransferase family protein n=1 Tax=Spirosoma spitsbergense TaxID=431554 RepID=UPI0003767877|nr:acyltransferase [Spirosoma spitsbergense]